MPVPIVPVLRCGANNTKLVASPVSSLLRSSRGYCADDVELPSGERAAIEALKRSRAAVRPAEGAIVRQHQAEILVGALDVASDATLHLSFEHWIVAGEALCLGGVGCYCKGQKCKAIAMNVRMFLLIVLISWRQM